MAGTAEEALRLARRDLGYAEEPAGSNRTKFGAWYGLNGNAWCATAVSFWTCEGGTPLPASTGKGFAYTPSGAAWFQRQHRRTIEGNTDERGGRTGGKVMRKVRRRSIAGFGRPPYGSGPSPGPLAPGRHEPVGYLRCQEGDHNRHVLLVQLRLIGTAPASRRTASSGRGPRRP